jgi:hypothetical protein
MLREKRAVPQKMPISSLHCANLKAIAELALPEVPTGAKVRLTKAKVSSHRGLLAYRTLRERNREFVVRLPTATNAQPVSVVWVDPDGKRVAVPFTK